MRQLPADGYVGCPQVFGVILSHGGHRLKTPLQQHVPLDQIAVFWTNAHVSNHELAREFEAKGIDVCGENGQFHTVVTDGPLFNYPIQLAAGQRVLKDGYWFLDFAVENAQ
jgi:hypothetical protein